MSRFLASVRHSLPFLLGGVAGLIASSVAVAAASAAFVNLQITSVRNGETVSGVVQLVTTADGEGVTSVQFQLDGRALGAVIISDPCTFAWDTRSAGEGPHSLGVFARDSLGTTFFAPDVSVHVLNDQPRRARPR